MLFFTGTVYDYVFLWESKKWAPWMRIIDKFEVDAKLSFSEIIVPTSDSVRNTYLLDLLLSNGNHVLLVGGSGTGKTTNVSQYLQGTAKVQGTYVHEIVCVVRTFWQQIWCFLFRIEISFHVSLQSLFQHSLKFYFSVYFKIISFFLFFSFFFSYFSFFFLFFSLYYLIFLFKLNHII